MCKWFGFKPLFLKICEIQLLGHPRVFTSSEPLNLMINFKINRVLGSQHTFRCYRVTFIWIWKDSTQLSLQINCINKLDIYGIFIGRESYTFSWQMVHYYKKHFLATVRIGMHIKLPEAAEVPEVKVFHQNIILLGKTNRIFIKALKFMSKKQK